MGNWKSQALIAAPVQEVWDLVGDPRRHAEWFPLVMEVSGLPAVESDATYRQVSRLPGRPRETTFLIEDLDDLREIGVRCTDTGTYVRFLLTPAQGETFAEVDIGFEPTSFMVRAFDATVGKRYCKRWTEDALDGLRGAVGDGSDDPAR
jgi:Polyketide cyclase / dehydrase and lipid transport